MKKISAFVHDLSSNPIVRAHPILHALKNNKFEIEVVGFLINDKKIFNSYKDYYSYKTVYIGKSPSIFKIIYNSFKIFKYCDGDYIYIFKPLPTTCLPALLYSFFRKKKIICCDVEDNEISLKHGNFRKLLKSIWSIKYNYLFHLYFVFKKKITVANKELQKKYGGEIIYHGPVFHHDIHSKIKNTNFFLEKNKKFIFFGGTPRDFKGLELIKEIIKNPKLKGFKLITAGINYDDSFTNNKNIKNYKYLGLLNHREINFVMKQIDIVIIPQKYDSFSKFQTPAKLLEAMAYKKIIITSDLPVMREIVGDNNGLILNNLNKETLIDALLKISENEQYFYIKSQNAFEFFKKNASLEANKIKYSKIFYGIQ